MTPGGPCPRPDEFLRETGEKHLRPALSDLLDRVVSPLPCGLAIRGRPRGDQAEARDLVGKTLGEGQGDVSAKTVSRDRNPPHAERSDEPRHLVRVRVDRRPAYFNRGTLPESGKVWGQHSRARGGDPSRDAGPDGPIERPSVNQHDNRVSSEADRVEGQHARRMRLPTP